MLDLGWSELLIIGVAALIVVGPKDLPKMLRTLGQYAGRAKGIAREFQRSMDEAARQADLEELKDVKDSLDDLRQEQYKMQREMGQSFLEGSSKTKKTVNPMTEPKSDSPKEMASEPEAEAPEAAEPPAGDPAEKSAQKASGG